MHINYKPARNLAKPIHDCIESKVKRSLFPSAKTLEFKFNKNKVAIYEEGGNFQAHRDTVYAPNHKRTLLIAMPSLHCGGDLVLTPLIGPTVTWQTSLNPNVLSWCAFRTDIIHEVKAVKAGVRIVLQFEIYCDDIRQQHQQKKRKKNILQLKMQKII